MIKKIKTVVIVPDGMADLKIESLGGKSPMEAAEKPCMNFLAENGICGIVKTVPDDMTPESDTANLAILGYNPKIYSKGRSPLEAVSMGLLPQMRENDTAFRCNLVTLSENSKKNNSDGVTEYEDRIITDHSADEISTEEADFLIKSIVENFGNDKMRFYTGVSYRHCLLWENCPEMCNFMRPHDILGESIAEYLPDKNKYGEYFSLMEKSYDILKNHPVNQRRVERGLKPANSIWIWGPGTRPDLPKFKDKYNLEGSVVAAVDLIKGIGICAGLDSVDVEGATGNLHTAYENKAAAVINEFEKGKDFVFVHIEAPDECGHRGELENKIKSIEKIDSEVIFVIYDYLVKSGDDFKIIVLPDHYTPVSLRTHSSEPVPFLMYHKSASEDNKKNSKSRIDNFNEHSAAGKSNIFIPNGYELLDFLLK